MTAESAAAADAYLAAGIVDGRQIGLLELSIEGGANNLGDRSVVFLIGHVMFSRFVLSNCLFERSSLQFLKTQGKDHRDPVQYFLAEFASFEQPPQMLLFLPFGHLVEAPRYDNHVNVVAHAAERNINRVMWKSSAQYFFDLVEHRVVGRAHLAHLLDVLLAMKRKILLQASKNSPHSLSVLR